MRAISSTQLWLTVAKFKLTTFSLIGVLAGSISSAWATDAKRPNVILVLADDLGAKELSCYGSQLHHTPRLDKMAREGIRLETFFAMPLCTPTRVSLMTGQYGFHNGYLGMQNPAFIPADSDPKRAIGNHFTHADMMKAAGYATAMAGKWQLSGELPTLIRDAGFDEYRMWAYDHNLPAGVKHPAKEGGPNSNTSRYWHPSIVQNGEYLPTKPEDFGPDLFNDFVLDFARRHREQPFFIYYTSVLTHGPRVETPDPQNPGKRWPKGLKSNLEYLDHLMGKLLDGLKESGQDENTIVIFIGDNGTGSDGKGTSTELGARVPCIIRGAGVKAVGSSLALADLTDIFPTLAALSGAKLPADKVLDGKSMLPLLKGETDEHREWIYSHLDDGRIVRDARWLVEIDRGNSSTKFYDCGDNRNGSGYRDVTDSSEAEVQKARARFDAILSSLPRPTPRADAPEKEKKRKKRKAAV